MRDLSTNELGQVYGAGGQGCSPQPPTCGGAKRSKSKKSKSKKHSKSRRYC